MKYGLIGEKLSHSFSKQIHEQLFDYSYELIELSQVELDAFLKKRDFCAVNVTLPYKEAVIPYLDAMDEMAAQIGAVNTIVHREGKLYGYNTDYYGLHALIERSGISVADKKVLILGSGGTSKTARTVAQKLGCQFAERVSRTGRDGCITYEQAVALHSDAQVIINTTPCGMYPNGGESPIDIDQFLHLEGVVDVIYNPLRTKLVGEALRRGIPAVGGLYMLVSQAAYAAELFVGKKVSQTNVNVIFNRLCSERENIVLVGMPGCGKSTVGFRLAQSLGRSFIDIDALIVEQMASSIPELFQRMGEVGFRDVEAGVIRRTASVQGAVIATGGGAVLRADNIEQLKENGRIYFLDRSLSLLPVGGDRPLSANVESLQRIYRERYPIYCTECDTRVNADGAVDEVVNEIREDFLNEYIGD